MDSLKQINHGQEKRDTLSKNIENVVSGNGKIILVELEEFSDIASCFPICLDVLFFTPNADEFLDVTHPLFNGWKAHKIIQIIRTIQRVSKNWQDEIMNINFLIHRIDMMDLDLSKMERGSIRKGMIGQLSKKILKGSNVIITSSQEEYLLREICDLHINLRIP